MNEKLAKIINHPVTIPVAVGVASFAAGVGVAFGFKHILKRKNTAERLVFDEDRVEAFLEKHEEACEPIMAPPIEDVPENVIIRNGDKVVSGKTFTDQLVHVIDSTPEPEPVERNVFAGSNFEWNYEEELKTRSEKAPYVIHKDEFYGEEMDYSQTTLTYYAGDNIMCDEEDIPVYNYDTIVGPLLFGHGSSDPNVFHIRNDERRAEYEILHDQGYFSVEVLGLHAEDVSGNEKDLKHSSDSVRKFRME